MGFPLFGLIAVVESDCNLSPEQSTEKTALKKADRDVFLRFDDDRVWKLCLSLKGPLTAIPTTTRFSLPLLHL